MTTTTELWTLERLRSLTEPELIEIWRGLPVPTVEEMNGEFQGALPVPMSITHAEFHKVNGPGEWIGKAYTPTPYGEHDGQGHNIFFTPEKVHRSLRFAWDIGPSLIDGRPALMMYYSVFQHMVTEFELIDEIRKVEDGLYVCIAHTGVATDLFGPLLENGRSSPTAFALRGPFGPWKGADDLALEEI